MPPGRSARSTKVFEVFMVGVDVDRGFCSLQVDPPLLEPRDHRELEFVELYSRRKNVARSVTALKEFKRC